jgi:hypothetical protein
MNIDKKKITILVSVLVMLAILYAVYLIFYNTRSSSTVNQPLDSGITNEVAVIKEDVFTDSDNDGVSNGLERQQGTDPFNAQDVDKDLDGIHDADELVLGSSSDTFDTDRDRIFDLQELVLHTNILEKEYQRLIEDKRGELQALTDKYRKLYGVDSDGDGITDFSEIFVYKTAVDPYVAEYSPSSFLEDIPVAEKDSDFDGLYDAEELAIGTDVEKADTDGDRYGDYQEILSKTDPLVAEDIRPFGYTEEELDLLAPYLNTDSNKNGIRDFVEILVLKTMKNPINSSQ